MGFEDRRPAVVEQGDPEPALHPDRLRRRAELGPGNTGNGKATGQDAGTDSY